MVKIYTCKPCNGTGGIASTCDICGGSGKRQTCEYDECMEYGCGGYGFCAVEAHWPKQTKRASGWWIGPLFVAGVLFWAGIFWYIS